MSPETYDQVCGRYPDLADRVLAKLISATGGQIDAGEVEWTFVECHDDFDQPLDEAACADVTLLGELPCRHGVAGRCAGYFACFCEESCEKVPRESRRCLVVPLRSTARCTFSQ